MGCYYYCGICCPLFHLSWHWYLLWLACVSYLGSVCILVLPITLLQVYLVHLNYILGLHWARTGFLFVVARWVGVSLIITNNTTPVILVFAQGNLVVVSRRNFHQAKGHCAVQVSSFCLYLDMTVMMLWVLLVPKSVFQIWTGSDIQ